MSTPFLTAARYAVLAVAVLALCQTGDGPQAPSPPPPTHAVQALLDQADKAAEAGRRPQAVAGFEAALALAREKADRPGEARALTGLATQLRLQGRTVDAIDRLRQAETAQREIGDREGLGYTLATAGGLLAEIGKMREAAPMLAEAAALYRDLGDKQSEAVALLGQAMATANSDPGASAALRQQALALARQCGDLSIQAQALLALGDRMSLEQALAIFEKLGNRGFAAATLTNLAGLHRAQGRPADAIACYGRALEAAGQAGDTDPAAALPPMILANLGALYFHVRQFDLAEHCLTQARDRFRRAGHRAQEAWCLANLGAVFASSGQRARARAFHQEALPLLREAGNTRAVAATLANIGATCDDPLEALRCLEEAQAVYRGMGVQDARASDLVNMGTAQSRLKRYDDARANYVRALQAADSDAQHQALAYRHLARDADAQGRYAEAERCADAAIAVIEAHRAKLATVADGASAFLAWHLTPYHHAVACRLRSGRVSTAYALAQRTKARGLLDRLGDGRSDAESGWGEPERARMAQLRRAVGDANRKLVASLAAGVGTDRAARSASAALAQADRELMVYANSVTARRSKAPVGLLQTPARLEDVGRSLPADAALLEYCMGCGVVPKEGPVVFVVTKKGSATTVTAHPVAATEQQIRRDLAALRRSCAERRGAWAVPAASLYRALIGPVRARIAGRTRLIVCPDGPIWGVPFGVLTPGGGPGRAPAPSSPLVDRYEISYAYSGSAYSVVRSRKVRKAAPGGAMLVVANPDFSGQERTATQGAAPAGPAEWKPPTNVRSAAGEVLCGPGAPLSALPGTEREARAIRALFPGAALLVGRRAQEPAVKQALRGRRYLHFATHGVVNSESPYLSSLALAVPQTGDEDGYLTAREVAALNLDAELAVLSACDTARGSARAGEGVVGLTWAFAAAGVRNQVGTLWHAGDQATAVLVAAFYRDVKRGVPASAALRNAQLTLRRGDRYSHPYHWAPFVLLGDGGR